METGSPKPKCWQCWLFLEALRENLYQASHLASSGGGQSLEVLGLWLHHHHPSLHCHKAFFPVSHSGSLYQNLPLLSLIKVLVIGLRVWSNPTHLILIWLHLPRPLSKSDTSIDLRGYDLNISFLIWHWHFNPLTKTLIWNSVQNSKIPMVPHESRYKISH